MFGDNLYSAEMCQLMRKYNMPPNWQVVLLASYQDRLSRSCWQEAKARWKREAEMVSGGTTNE